MRHERSVHSSPIGCIWKPLSVDGSWIFGEAATTPTFPPIRHTQAAGDLNDVPLMSNEKLKSCGNPMLRSDPTASPLLSEIHSSF